MAEPMDRSRFLLMAGVFEGGLVFVALALGKLLRVDPFAEFRIHSAAVLLGFAAALPPFVLLTAMDRFQFSALERIKRHLFDILGPSIAACRWYELVFVAALAGLGEELVFRGVIQRSLEHWLAFGGWDRIGGLIASNVIFGLLHFITPTYAVVAAALGIYFGVLLDATDPPNVVVPILAHGFYDYLAFLWLKRAVVRSRQPAELPATRD
jgi:membrane protease YdiL (CAAX protease family)